MKMLYRMPACCWLEKFPLGNGRIGVMAGGDPDIETLGLNEDTLWSGIPGEEQPEFEEDYLKKAAKLAEEGRYDEATSYLREQYADSRNSQMYLPAGNLELRYLGGGEVTEYVRTLDLSEAVMKASWKKGRGSFQVEAFASAPANLFVYRISSDEVFDVAVTGKEGFFTGRTCAEDGVLKIFGQCPGKSYRRTFVEGSDAVDVTEPGMAYQCWCRAEAEGGEIKETEQGIECLGMKELTLYVGIRTSYNGYDKNPVTEGADPEKQLIQDLAAADKGYEALKQEHIADFLSFSGRAVFTLPDTGKEDLDLSERLVQFEAEGNDPKLYELLYDYGKYMAISASRPGTQPTNLQGIWNDQKKPSWSSNYTVNINTEMNYWLTGPCDLNELSEPLIRMNRELLDNGRRTARNYFGANGSCAFHNVDLWRKTTPAYGQPIWNFWPFGAAWMCRNLYDTYLFTEDTELLRNEIYPILRENALFLADLVTMTEKGYAFTPATSPENCFYCNGISSCVSYYTENTIAIGRNLFRDVLEASEILGIADELTERLKEILANMVPVQIDSQGRIMEWNEELPETQVTHRHLSHLYEFHPGRGITNDTPELKEAVRKSLEVRGDMGTGWSFAWKLLMWARMEDGEHAKKIMDGLFHIIDPTKPINYSAGGLYPNLMCAHPPFQIDGNYGYTAGVAEMLLQSHAGEIVILPAIPAEWSSGTAKGFLARGNIKVDIEWEAGTIRAVLTAKQTKDVWVRIRRGEKRMIRLEAGVPTVVEEQNG